MTKLCIHKSFDDNSAICFLYQQNETKLKTAHYFKTIAARISCLVQFFSSDFLADRTNGRAYATVLRLSSVRL